MTVFLKKVDLPFLKLKFQKNFHKNFQNILYVIYCPEAITEKLVKLTCIVIGLKVLDNGAIFSGIVRRQTSDSFVCKHRRTEESKTKVYIFVFEIFTNSFYKSYTAIAMWHRARAKWNHCKAMSLFLSSTL